MNPQRLPIVATRRPHYLRALKTDGIPATHVVFDCETTVDKKWGVQSHRWRCGAFAVVRRVDTGHWQYQLAEGTRHSRELWEKMLACADEREQLVIWAHRLDFDLQVSQGLRHLPDAGYEVSKAVLHPGSTWVSWEGPGRGLLLCDLWSWLREPLDTLAVDMGEVRAPFDYPHATAEQLLGRAREDVTLTAYALMAMLTYLDAEGVGKLAVTGSGQCHRAWRRKYLPDRTLLVHTDRWALETERRAMHTGRAESWRHGEIEGPLFEYDLNLAYCRIAATQPVPVKLLGALPIGNRRTGNLEVADTLTCALCRVKAELPLVPTEGENGIVWPVGEFESYLWQPEIDLLRESGADVYLRYGFHYEAAPALADMSRWIIAQLEAPPGEVSLIAKRLLKHWARALVGRCASEYPLWEYWGENPSKLLGITYTHDAENPEYLAEHLHIGNRDFEQKAVQESEDSLPQVTGYIMSQARVNLWRLMVMAEPDNLIYVDTDCVIVNRAGAANLRYWQAVGHGELVLKREWQSARIIAPRNIRLEQRRRIAGVPLNAREINDHLFRGEVWIRPETALTIGETEGVPVQERTFDVTAKDTRRRHLAGGKTLPLEVCSVATD